MEIKKNKKKASKQETKKEHNSLVENFSMICNIPLLKLSV